MADDERAFSFLRVNPRPPKPRTTGLTEIRGPYYTPLGPRYLQDVLDTFGSAVDILKFAGGSFALMPRQALRDLIDLCHRHQVLVSTGGFITLPADDFVRLTERVRAAGLKPKPEVGIQFGAGGASAAAELEAEGTRDPGLAIALARRYLDAGAELIMIESEGITENVRAWRSDVPQRFAEALGTERVMFEAADPEVFGWYVKTFGPEVNLFVDHSQVVQLECLRSGVWGTKDVWGRVLTWKG